MYVCTVYLHQEILFSISFLSFIGEYCFVESWYCFHRVLNVLRHWVEFHYYDFERDSKLLEKLEQFVGTVKSRNMQKWVTSIHRALKKVTVVMSGWCRQDFHRLSSLLSLSLSLSLSPSLSPPPPPPPPSLSPSLSHYRKRMREVRQYQSLLYSTKTLNQSSGT